MVTGGIWFTNRLVLYLFLRTIHRELLQGSLSKLPCSVDSPQAAAFDFNSPWESVFSFHSLVRGFRSDFSSVAEPAVMQTNIEEMCSATPAVSRPGRPAGSS